MSDSPALIVRIGEFQDALERLGVKRERIKFAEKSSDEIIEIVDSIERQVETRIAFLSRLSEKELKSMNLANWKTRLKANETLPNAVAIEYSANFIKEEKTEYATA